MEKLVAVKGRLVDDHLDALRLDALHDALDRGGTEVVRTCLHDQTEDPHPFRVPGNDVRGDKVFAHGVGVDDGLDEGLWHVLVIG